MGRQQRLRSSSGGSVTEMIEKKQPSQEEIQATSDLLNILVHLHDNSGKNFLHNVASAKYGKDANSSLHIGLNEILIQRATQFDIDCSNRSCNNSSNNNRKITSSLERLLLSKDKESGYSPLHWAITSSNLPVILQLLRHASNSHELDAGGVEQQLRLRERPMFLLQGDQLKKNSKDLLLSKMINDVDNEGLTPLDLLCKLQRQRLNQCRRSIDSNIANLSRTDNYNDQFRVSASYEGEYGHNENNEFHVLQQQQEDAGIDKSVAVKRTDECACEVLTFGRANHCALGVGTSGTSSENHSSSLSSNTCQQQQVRPQRVQAFALADLGADKSAVGIAASTHHTFVVTKNGHLYSFGYGKGGRLGTGDDRHRPLPTRVLGPLNKRFVVAVAAAENHSLCVTRCGGVYAWGSNRFGQLSTNARAENNDDNTSTQRFSPRRVDNLKHVFCVNVAAGDRHSVALTNRGEVYTWGDNSSGQLGVKQHNGKDVHRVEALWSGTQLRIATSIAASGCQTLVLTCPPKQGNNAGSTNLLPTNTIYSWGLGNNTPTRIYFTDNLLVSSKSSSNQESTLTIEKNQINPIAIACANWHCAAVTEDGRVFTWGLHKDALGTNSKCKQQQHQQKYSSSQLFTSPQLVTKMLPEAGGGTVVAVSASENHTAVLTDCGHLFTWGEGKDVLGHKGVKFQPSPLRVPGVYRAISVAAAKEHTVLLMGTSIPAGKTEEVSDQKFNGTLEMLAARSVTKHVDLYNVIPVLVMAERINCEYLVEYCKDFIRLNLDGVLTLCRKSEMDRYLNDKLADGVHGWEFCERDVHYHPLIFDLLGAEKKLSTTRNEFEFNGWVQHCSRLLDRLPASLIARHTSRTHSSSRQLGMSRSRSLSFNESSRYSVEGASNSGGAGSFHGCSERCIMLTGNMKLDTEDSVRSKFDSLSKEMRGIRKRLNQIDKLRQTGSKPLTDEQVEKVSRLPLLKADLDILGKALSRVEEKMRSMNIVVRKRGDSFSAVTCENGGIKDDSLLQKDKVTNAGRKEVNDKESPEGAVSPEKDDADDLKAFRCDICKISCPDANSFELHKNGRKHRNRILQVEEEEKKQAAASMSKTKMQQLLSTANVPVSPKKSSPWQNAASRQPTAAQPRYMLSPPPHAVVHSPVLSGRAGPSWNTSDLPPPKKPIGNNSFQKILEEEQKKAPRQRTEIREDTQVSKTPKKASTKPNKMAVSTHSLLHSQSQSNVDSSSGKKKMSLNDFLISLEPVPAAATSPGHQLGSWATQSPASTKSHNWKTPSPYMRVPTGARRVKSPFASKLKSAGKSFLEIQQEEEDFKSREDQQCTLEGKWYIQQRERAGSISKIQQEETENREMEKFVEEQKKIQEQIELELQKKKEHEEKKAKKKNLRNSKRKKNTTKQKQTDNPDKGAQKETNTKSEKNTNKSKPSKNGQRKKKTGRNNCTPVKEARSEAVMSAINT